MPAIHRLIAGSLVALAAVVGAANHANAQAGGRGPARPEVRGVVKSLDTATGMITVSVVEGREQVAVKELTYPLAKDVEVVVGGGGDRRVASILKAAKLGDLVPGVTVALALTLDNAVVEAIMAEWPTLPGQIRAVDTSAGTITIARVSRGENLDAKTFPVAKDVRIVIDGVEAKLADIKVSDSGPFATLRLSLDQKTVQSIQAGQSR